MTHSVLLLQNYALWGGVGDAYLESHAHIPVKQACPTAAQDGFEWGPAQVRKLS